MFYAFFQRVQRRRLGIIKALQLITALLQQKLTLLRRFHSFGTYAQAQVPCQIEYGFYYQGILFRFIYIVDKFPVYFDGVNTDTGQITEGLLDPHDSNTNRPFCRETGLFTLNCIASNPSSSLSKASTQAFSCSSKL